MNVAEVKALADQVRAEIGKAIVGQRDTIDLMLTALFAVGHDLPIEGGDAGALLGPRTLARSSNRLAVRHAARLDPSCVVLMCWPSCGPVASLQGTRDLNPQPSVLETDALPVELVPSALPPTVSVAEARAWAWQSLWETTKR